jgi:acyl-CoA dehydrogenase
MKLTLDPQYEAFRAEVSETLAKNAHLAPTSEDKGYKNAKRIAWQKLLIANGLAARTIPKEYGGYGAEPDILKARIIAEEFARTRIPGPMAGQGISMFVPTLLELGTEAQKQAYIRPTIEGEMIWCQGYSEPGAGSDLAGLQTRAVDQGDHWIVNGQKVWTSYADKADWIFCLVRTDADAPKHLGISFVLFDMETPGVSTRPITLISGKSPFCETFFDDVRVEKANLVGTLNRGWDVAKYLLAHERTMIGAMGEIGGGRPLGQVATGSIGTDDEGRLDEPMLRARIAELEVDAAAFRLALERTGDQMKAGQAHPAIASMLKYYGSELNKRRHELLMAAGGIDALEWEGERSHEGAAARDWLRTKANSIEGGTSEIQLNIIAKHLLQLPGA